METLTRQAVFSKSIITRIAAFAKEHREDKKIPFRKCIGTAAQQIGGYADLVPQLSSVSLKPGPFIRKPPEQLASGEWSGEKMTKDAERATE